MIKSWRLMLAFFAVLLALSGVAGAHLMPAQQGTIHIVDNKVYVVLTVPVSALHGVDLDGDGKLSPKELGGHYGEIERQLVSRFSLSAPNDDSKVGLTMLMSPSTGEDSTLPTSYVLLMYERTFVTPPENLAVSTDLFGTLSGEGQLTFRATRGKQAEMVVLTPDRPAHRFFQGSLATFGDFISTGMWHILSGYDHLLFLLTVVVVGTRIRNWFVVVTMFTIAHSITLALAAAGWARVSPGFIEPMIALSIVAVAIDNLVAGDRRSLRLRVAIVFACGLLHGLGFASAISGFGLDRHHFVLSLVGFNLGIEVGQAMFLTGLWVLIMAIGKLGPLRMPHQRLVQVASVIAIVLGSALFLQRALGWV